MQYSRGYEFLLFLSFLPSFVARSSIPFLFGVGGGGGGGEGEGEGKERGGRMKDKEAEKKRGESRRGQMITRAKIVELLSERQIRSQHTLPLLLSCFSPNPHVSTRKDVSVALLYSLLFCFLVISGILTFRYRFLKTSCLLSLFGIFLIVCLKISRHRKLKRKRERRFLLPISM